MRLLLVEDDAMVGEAVRQGLRQDGFTIDWTQDGAAAETALRTESYDCVLLDLGLPRKSGLDVLRGLRLRSNETPVVIVTARDAVADRISGLDAGADDYVVKPFDLEEVAARVRAVVRRRQGRGAPDIEHRGLVLKPATREAQFRGTAVSLSRREFAIVEALASRPGAILSRQQLEGHVYGWGEEIESNAIEVFVHSLRKKLAPDFIVTVRGAGYMVPKP